FFFQAEDGIRDGHVTGVQTCALPISPSACRAGPSGSCGRRPGSNALRFEGAPSPPVSASNAEVTRVAAVGIAHATNPRRNQVREIGRASCRERVEILVVVVVLEEQR